MVAHLHGPAALVMTTAQRDAVIAGAMLHAVVGSTAVHRALLFVVVGLIGKIPVRATAHRATLAVGVGDAGIAPATVGLGRLATAAIRLGRLTLVAAFALTTTLAGTIGEGGRSDRQRGHADG